MSPILIFTLLFSVLFNGLLSLWTNGDCEKRNDPDINVWTLVVLIFGVIGFFIYLLKRPTR